MSQLLQHKTVAFVNSSVVPKEYWNGVGMDSTVPGVYELAIDTVAAIDHYHQGLPLTKDDRIAAEEAAVAFFNNGAMPITATGKLAIATAPNVPITFLAGVGYTDTGALFLE